MRALAVLASLTACPAGLSAQGSELAEVIEAVEAAFLVSEPQVIDGTNVESITLEIVPTGGSCDMMFKMQFDVSDPPSIATIWGATADLDPDAVDIRQPQSGDGPGILIAMTRDELPLLPFEIAISEGNELFSDMREVIAEGYADGTCTDRVCIVQDLENNFGVPLSPQADVTILEQTVDNIRTLIALCATAPADADVPADAG